MIGCCRAGMQHDRQKFEEGVDEEVDWSHQGDTFPTGLTATSSPS